MKWLKLGKIFDPTQSLLANDFVGFAQSPQALVFDDFVRIYFSIRKRSENGKFVSHIRYIDVDYSFKHIINVARHTVIAMGNLGCFDEHGIFPMNPVRYKDKVYAFTSGWTRRVSVSVDGCIGLAISVDDGLTFQRIGDGPVVAASLYEPFLVGDAFVLLNENVFHMWYIYGLGWKTSSESATPERIYKITHAFSQDGVNWNKDNRLLVADKYENECQALPTVIKIGDRWHMFFCYRQFSDFRNNTARAYRIGHAYSDNMNEWVRDDDNVGITVSNGDWDSDMLCYPHVFRCADKIFMLYNGNEFGRYGFGIAVLDEHDNI